LVQTGLPDVVLPATGAANRYRLTTDALQAPGAASPEELRVKLGQLLPAGVVTEPLQPRLETAASATTEALVSTYLTCENPSSVPNIRSRCTAHRPRRSAVPCALAPTGASYRASPVSWPDFAPRDQASLVRIIERKLKMV
jgi:hypothetical protein